ncbi:uncharacterized protein EI90DRAFT_1818086 [Cantharellus anzutake]|uniref:uncharacterized protein n=1 Tax=Cantharellus anzutake TaxID=1750568 RepID=UPI001903EB09|nr:uncharacterized protein EI90DRAFT_1818086 [Cantharellus anzutake]KAF8327141.1 hypothetical protein EI90DRAFT_1818086 [Cantharellus anzutake]
MFQPVRLLQIWPSPPFNDCRLTRTPPPVLRPTRSHYSDSMSFPTHLGLNNQAHYGGEMLPGAGEALPKKKSLPYTSDIHGSQPPWHAVVQAPSLDTDETMSTYQKGPNPLSSMSPVLINGESWCQSEPLGLRSFDSQRLDLGVASAYYSMNFPPWNQTEAQCLPAKPPDTPFSTSVSPQLSSMNGETHGRPHLPRISIQTSFGNAKTLSERKEGVGCDLSGVYRQSSSLVSPGFALELTESSSPSTLALGTYRGKSLPCVNKPMDWHMTLDDFSWLASVLSPKRRPNKREPTPSGTCRFCDVICARAGSLQQHVVFQHRQRIARKYIGNDHYNQDLALAFTVLQLDADSEYEDMSNTDTNMGGRRTTEEATESEVFRAALANGPVTSMASYPHLVARFHRFCMAEKWRGVHCSACGMLVQRKLNLSEHQAKCPAILGSQAAKPKGPGRSVRSEDNNQ